MTYRKSIKGLTSKHGLKIMPVLAQFTSDNLGETLSLAADGLQITVRYEDIETIVAYERARHGIEGDINGSGKA